MLDGELVEAGNEIGNVIEAGIIGDGVGRDAGFVTDGTDFDAWDDGAGVIHDGAAKESTRILGWCNDQRDTRKQQS